MPAFLHEARVPLPSAGGAVAHGGEKQLEIQALELQLQVTGHAVRGPKMFRQIAIDSLGQLFADLPSVIGGGRVGLDEEGIGVSVKDPMPRLLHVPAGPEEERLAEMRNGVGDWRGKEEASGGRQEAV